MVTKQTREPKILQCLEPVRVADVTNELIFIPTYQTIELEPQHVFQTPGDHFQKVFNEQ